MYKLKKWLFALFVICAFSNNAMAQWLEVKSEKDERSVSIKVKEGVPSSRVIVSSSLSLSYSSNMGDVTKESVGYGVVNGLNSDTIYFYLVDDYKRSLTIAADGYPPVSVSFTLAPKETYRCLVFDPNKKKDETSPTVNTAHWQFTMAQNFDFGRDGFSVDQIEALNWYTKAAEQGHGLAQVTLGVKYASGGDGFSKDEIKSARWFLIAAQQNYDSAQYAIAGCFLQGNGVKQDLDKAYYWFEQSADKGIDEARYKMANMLLDGYGTDVEVDKLLAWLSFFADENRSEAQYTYSKLLLGRKHTPENELIAVEYLNKAISLSNVDAMLLLAKRSFDKDLDQYNVIKGMELLRMAERLNSTEAKNMIESYSQSLSREEVFEYTKHFADRGDAIDMAALANMYYLGDGTEIDYDFAFHYFSKSGESDILDAFVGLGLCYYNGFGVKPDYDKAFEYLTKGNKDNNTAISGLGQCYFYGHGVEQNYDKAFELFTKANNGSNSVAINGLGLCYIVGQPVAKNEEKAIELFEEALKIDKYNAGVSLGDYYYTSDPVSNLDKAIDYYKLSATAGNPVAQNKLGLIVFDQGVVKELRTPSRGVTEMVYTNANYEIIDNALEWFYQSAKRNYAKGEYNFAYALIATLDKDNIKNSQRGAQSVSAFRILAEKGNRDAMIALASLYKYNIGIDLSEAYKWSLKAAEGYSEGKGRDGLYKGLLGCLEFDEAEAIAAILNSMKSEIQDKSATTMEAAASEGCTFVYSKMHTYLKDVKKDKKSAKIWSKKSDTLSEMQKIPPKITEFKR